MKVRNIFIFGATAGLLALSTGCDSLDDVIDSSDDSEALAAIDSMDMTNLEAAFMILVTDGLDIGGDAAAWASAAAENAQRLEPDGCATAGAAAGVVTFDLNDCSGPYGLSTMSGTAVVTFNLNAEGEIHADLSATGLTANGIAFEAITVRSVYDNPGNAGAQTLDINTQSTGTPDGGGRIVRNGDYTVSFNSGTDCYEIQGNWSTTPGTSGVYTTVVNNYDRCGEGCPGNGGNITYTGLEGTGGGEQDAITITFDGDGDARWVSTGLRSGTVDLICTE